MQDTVLADRYRLVDWLGGGSMGDVWLAEDEVLGRRVAVKVVKPALLDESGFAERFHAEARVMAQLRHPGIVGVYDYGHSAADGRSSVGYLVMELIDGEPLSAVLERRGTLPVAEALRMALQVLEALQAAHRSGVVHRDIKPANLMVRGDQAGAGRTVIADFGIARPGCDARLTVPGMVLGTAAYQAPEQASSGTVTASADLYALGVVLYECLAGRLPFDGETALEVILKHLTEPVPPLPEGVPAPVGALVARAMAKEPGERWPDAATMAAAVRAALAPGAEGFGAASFGAASVGGGLASTAPDRPRTPARHARRPGYRVRTLAGVTALTLLCVGGAAGATVIRTDRDGVSDAAAVARPSADLLAPPLTASAAADHPLAGQPSAPAPTAAPTAGAGESPTPSPEPVPSGTAPDRPDASPQAPAAPLPPPATGVGPAPAPAPSSAAPAQPTPREQPSPTATATATQPATPTAKPKPQPPAQAKITSLGAALDNYYSKDVDGNGINTYIVNGSEAQNWRLEKVSEGNYYLRNGSTNYQRVLDLDVKTGKVQIWANPPGADNQIWSLVPVTDGAYQIVNHATKECLTSAGVGYWASVATCTPGREGQVWTFS
ncbi:serine/threonine protein kinase [Streptomyces sp. Y1]|uniref:non-specific serine/threonine protein kinase n=1 Tax=Streptomyces sp. Y1 TaxID=3238634 RepID=A0AB39TUI5_9ACTN